MPRPLLHATLGLVLLASVRAEEPPGLATPIGLLKAIDEGFVQVFEKVAPAVVVIEAVKAPDDEEPADGRMFDHFLPREGDAHQPARPKDADDPRTWRLPPPRARSEGSGFIIRADGFILTNHHVIAGAERLTVRLRGGRRLPAKVAGFDDKTDIAVIRIDAGDLPVAEFGDSERLRVGQLVCAIGTPFNQDYSFTAGWVSGKSRTNLLGPSSSTLLYEDYIQTDAFINPGNSGGPLFDVEGRVVGMNTLINGVGRGLAFAIPASMLQEISRQLIDAGRVQRPWLGIRIETLGENETLSEHLSGVEQGVLVYTIEADAPAYKSDLRAADVITEVDGARVTTALDFQKQILRKKIGQTLQLTVWRRGAILKIPVATAELPGDYLKVANAAPAKPRAASAEALGLRLKDAEAGAGATVMAIAAESAASRTEIFPGDIITDVETRPVATAEACAQAIAAGIREKGTKGILLNLDRKGRRTFAILKSAE